MCGCRRCAYCRPDPPRPASAPGSRSRGRAATLVDTDLAPGPDDQQERSLPASTRRSPHADPEELLRAVAAVVHQTGLLAATPRVTAGLLSSPRHVAGGLRRRGQYLEACFPVDVQQAMTV